MIKKVLILYSHNDDQWKEQVDKHIRVLINAGYALDIDLWNESRIHAAEDWYPEFESSLNHAAAIVLLVSKSFLDSQTMQSENVRKRLKMKVEGGFPIFVVLVNKCPWKRFSWMKNLPLLPGKEKLLSDLSTSAIENTLTELAEKVAKALKLESQAAEGTLAYLQLNGIGPAKQLYFEPNRRLNIITGDNGFGKTFLLECAWWTLSGVWPENPAYPRDDSGIEDAKISFQLMAKSGSIGKTETVSYDWEKQQWPITDQRTSSPGLVIYARIDGSFAVWDPVRGKIPPPIGASKPLSPLIFNKPGIFGGIIEKIPGKDDRKLCNGLLWDWVYWQNTSHSPFDLFTKILDQLSTCSQEPLKPGKPVRVPGDSRQIPSLQYPYGAVPLIHAASSVQRIISLAYLLLWTWEEHKVACGETRKTTYKNMVVLIDEVESHMHPQWQRSIISSLLEVKKHLDHELDIQFFITTHSPLVLASVEPVFEEENDKLFHLDTRDNKIVLEEQPFLRHGRVDNWYTSEIFDLQQARSLEAEKALGEARTLQQKPDPTSKEVKDMHCRLVRLLGTYDTFWPRWLFWAEKHGVNNDSCSEAT